MTPTSTPTRARPATVPSDDRVRRVPGQLFAVMFGLLLLLQGCQRADAPAKRQDQLVVFAAASLREAFGKLALEFEKGHPHAAVSFNFAGTQEIRTQLEQGAAADVFASADTRQMALLLEARRVESPTVFAQNEPVLIVARDSVSSIRALSELPRAERIVIGAPEVPIGKYTLQILRNASQAYGADFSERVQARVVSRELNVRQVLAKVTLGEADAGVVYRSDVGAAGPGVGVVTIPSEINVTAQYPMALVRGAAHFALGSAWCALVLSDKGQAILRAAGFSPPPLVEAKH